MTRMLKRRKKRERRRRRRRMMKIEVREKTSLFWVISVRRFEMYL